MDYRHVIGSLVKKPQAFRYSRLRDDLLPTQAYRRIWQHVDNTMSAKSACRFMVSLLYLAHTESCESQLAEAVLSLIDKGAPLSLSFLQMQFKKDSVFAPRIEINHHELSGYNALISQDQQQEVAYV